MAEWTHKRLVRRMAQWMKGTKRMSVVFAELATRVSETPDVIGWQSDEMTAPSILVECKVSRADFLADGKKWFRRYASMGMGDLRYVAAPAGLLHADEMPEGWGLLEVDRYVRVTKEAEKMPACKGRECVMLVSALRRLEIATAVYVVANEDTANAPRQNLERSNNMLDAIVRQDGGGAC